MVDLRSSSLLLLLLVQIHDVLHLVTATTRTSIQQNRSVMAWIADIGSDEEYGSVVGWVTNNSDAINAVSDTTLYKVLANGSIVGNERNIRRHAVWKRHGIRVSQCTTFVSR